MPITDHEWELAHELLDEAPDGTKLRRTHHRNGKARHRSKHEGSLRSPSKSASFIRLHGHVYSPGRTIGRGSYGTVKTLWGEHGATGMLAKISPGRYHTNEEHFLKKLDYSLGMVERPDNGKVYLPMPNLGRSLLRYLQEEAHLLSDDLRLKHAIDFALIVHDLHLKDIAHLDLKPENATIDPASMLHAIDFGTSEENVHAILQNPRGTFWYSPPYTRRFSQETFDAIALKRMFFLPARFNCPLGVHSPAPENLVSILTQDILDKYDLHAYINTDSDHCKTLADFKARHLAPVTLAALLIHVRNRLKIPREAVLSSPFLCALLTTLHAEGKSAAAMETILEHQQDFLRRQSWAGVYASDMELKLRFLCRARNIPLPKTLAPLYPILWELLETKGFLLHARFLIENPAFLEGAKQKPEIISALLTLLNATPHEDVAYRTGRLQSLLSKGLPPGGLNSELENARAVIFRRQLRISKFELQSQPALRIILNRLDSYGLAHHYQRVMRHEHLATALAADSAPYHVLLDVASILRDPDEMTVDTFLHYFNAHMSDWHIIQTYDLPLTSECFTESGLGIIRVFNRPEIPKAQYCHYVQHLLSYPENDRCQILEGLDGMAECRPEMLNQWLPKIASTSKPEQAAIWQNALLHIAQNGQPEDYEMVYQSFSLANDLFALYAMYRLLTMGLLDITQAKHLLLNTDAQDTLISPIEETPYGVIMETLNGASYLVRNFHNIETLCREYNLPYTRSSMLQNPEQVREVAVIEALLNGGFETFPMNFMKAIAATASLRDAIYRNGVSPALGAILGAYTDCTTPMELACYFSPERMMLLPFGLDIGSERHDVLRVRHCVRLFGTGDELAAICRVQQDFPRAYRGRLTNLLRNMEPLIPAIQRQWLEKITSGGPEAEYFLSTAEYLCTCSATSGKFESVYTFLKEARDITGLKIRSQFIQMGITPLALSHEQLYVSRYFMRHGMESHLNLIFERPALAPLVAECIRIPNVSKEALDCLLQVLYHSPARSYPDACFRELSVKLQANAMCLNEYTNALLSGIRRKTAGKGLFQSSESMQNPQPAACSSAASSSGAPSC